MARIIPLRGSPGGDEHHEVELLLPWYATDRLAPDEAARVAAHLAGCAACRDELEAERGLAREIRDLPAPADDGWARVRARIAADQAGRARGFPALRAVAAEQRRQAGWIWGAIAAQLAVVAFVGALSFRALQAPAYRTLSAGAPPPAGDLIAVFRPDTTEATLRQILQAADVRLADGPTAGGAYVLRAAPSRRTAALASLRARPEVVLAQPLDASRPAP